MGNWNSGRRPQSNALKILRGNPGKRRLAVEPEPPPLADTKPPRELTGDSRARAEWRRLVPLLRGYDLITEADRAALVALCLQWSTYLEARQTLRRDGLTIETKQGQLRSPCVAIAQDALTHCERLWAEFGLTPAGRAKVARVPPARTPPATKWAGLL